MAKITLVNYVTGDKWVPLGCLQILTFLKNEKYQVKFIDLQTIDNGIHKSNLLCDDSKYLLISTISMMLPWLFQATKTIKNKHPEKKIILGGPGVSSISEEILKSVDSIDYIVEGPGEVAIVELIKTLESGALHDLRDIPGIAYRENNCIIKNRAMKQDKQNVFFIDRTDIHVDDYDVVSSIITSYGCPYNCGFCYNHNIWSKNINFKPLKQIFNEIDDILSRYNLNYIVFVDDLFFVSKKRCCDFFNLYKTGKYKVKYVILGARLDSIDNNTLINLKETNCVSLSFGLESASNRILKKIGKKITIEKALQVINRVKKYIPDISPSLIVGFPFETLAEFYKTIELAVTLHSQGLHVVINFLRPLVGTKIYNEYKNELFADFRGIIRPFEIDEQIKKIIEGNSVLYSWYYTYKTPALEEKIRVYREMNMKFTRIQQRFMHMKI